MIKQPSHKKRPVSKPTIAVCTEYSAYDWIYGVVDLSAKEFVDNRIDPDSRFDSSAIVRDDHRAFELF